MTHHQLSEMLDKVYELEGLVMLALSRDDSRESIERLINVKIGELGSSADVSDIHPSGGGFDFDASYNLEEPEPEPAVEIPAPAPAVEVAAPAPASAPAVEIAAPAVEIAAPAPAVEIPAPVPVSAPAVEPPVIAPAPQTPAPANPAETPAPARSGVAGRLVFSINDRYRYRRELFGGNDAAFSDALSRVAAMDSYDEAEGYFLDDCQWDPERPEVVDFMGVLRKYFES